MGTGMPTFVWQTIPHVQDLQAQIRSDLVNFLALSGSKQKYNGRRLAQLEKSWLRLEKIGLNMSLDDHAQKIWKWASKKLPFPSLSRDRFILCECDMYEFLKCNVPMLCHINSFYFLTIAISKLKNSFLLLDASYIIWKLHPFNALHKNCIHHLD